MGPAMYPPQGWLYEPLEEFVNDILETGKLHIFNAGHETGLSCLAAGEHAVRLDDIMHASEVGRRK